MNPKNICYIIDVDGFHITRKPYLVKEIDIFNFRTSRSFLYRFRPLQIFPISFIQGSKEVALHCFNQDLNSNTTYQTCLKKQYPTYSRLNQPI